MNSRTMQAKTFDARGNTAAVGEPATGTRQPAATTLLAKVRQLLRDGEIYDARRLAAEAVREHPGHPDLLRVHEVLNVGRSQRRPATGSSIREDLEGLRDPPQEYRGKWVAVIGHDIVGVAASLKELVAGLPADLEQAPLAVQIAS